MQAKAKKHKSIDFFNDVWYNGNRLVFIKKGGMIKMKKYFLADILTTIEVVTAIVIAVVTFLPDRISPDIIIWLFVIGELCDAFDGICARRWRYPEDGKRRWWREHAAMIDQISDIMLIFATAFYLVIDLGKTYLLALSVGIGVFCTLVEVWKNFHYSERLVLFRRYVYLGAIAIALFELLFATSWNRSIKGLAVLATFIVGITLMIVKRNRLTEDVTK